MSDHLIDALRLAAIVESSDDAIVGKDVNGIITSWNRGAERIFGYSAEEVIGKSITIIIPADRLNEETYVLSRIRAGQKVDHFETLRQRKDGTLIPISLTTSPILDASGRVIGASKIARDISDRRHAEAALAEAEARRVDLQQRLVALLAASGTLFGSPRLHDVVPAVLGLGKTLIRADASIVWRFEPETGRWTVAGSLDVSEEFRRRIAEAFPGRPFAPTALSEPLVAESVADAPLLAEQLPVYQAEGIESLLAVPLSIGGPRTGTLVFYYKTRHTFSDVEVDTARSLSDLAAAAITTAVVYEEQRRQREDAERTTRHAAFLAEAGAALASSLNYESTLRTVAQLAVPRIADWCVIDIVDDRGDIRRLAIAHVDPALVELAETLREREWHDPARPGSIAHVIRTGTPALVAKITDDMIASAARDDVAYLQTLRQLGLRSYIAVPLAAHGRTFGALVFVMADSGREYQEVDLRFAQDVAYRAALAIENARAYQQASAANRAKDEFLATLSHELRTPLNAVLGWARMLRAGTLDPGKMTRAVEVIERNAIAQLHLVEDLLDLSRVITGKFHLAVGPVDLSEVIAGTVDAILPAATAKGIVVRVHTEQGVCAVIGDRPRLQQVIWNLLSNAIKFTPAGGEVRIVIRPRGDSQIDVEVADTGEGIAPDVLPYVFDRFRQGESGTTRTHSGLGLGLAIVRHIVELHGGQVAVESAGPGQGSTFRLSLPVHVEGRPAVAGAAEAPRPPLSERLAGLRALVVDDDRDARELVTEVLRSRGMEVTTAASADEGLAALDRDVPDIIVSDIAMPEHDGYDLIRQVRQRPSDRGGLVPAVALTAYARPEDTERSLSSGFQLHLAKPVDVDNLVSAVASLAGR